MLLMLVVLLSIGMPAECVILQPLDSEMSATRSWDLISAEKRISFADNNGGLGAPIICPGGAQCPAFATCCMLTSGQYGCCPFPEAVCCSDQIHCCPSGNQCDMQQQRCKASNGHSVPLQKRYVWPDDYFLQGKLKSITCEDKQSECPDNTTCCEMQSGGWGCCPFESAVCCSDKQHCCPKDSTCNLRDKKCERSPLWMFVSVLAAGDNSTVVDTICPDQKQHCTPGATCCPLKSGSFGCCPFDKADCCTDGLHCCPQGFKCDLKSSKCTKAM